MNKNIEIYEEQLEKLKNIEMTHDNETNYTNLYNFITDFEEVTEICDLEETDFYNNVITFDTLEEMAKRELETGGLERLYYFLPKEYNPYLDNIFYINVYGNVENITSELMGTFKEELIEYIEDIIKELKQ